MSLHKNLTIGDQHVIHNWEYANSTVREAASGFVGTDLKKLALQLDDNSLWLLTATTPTWISASGVATHSNLANLDYASAGHTGFASLTEAQTLTNKRITARASSEASSATPTINTDNVDIHRVTALALDITSMTTNLTGTPVHGDCLLIEITGTAARAITWGASFEASTVALPTTTITTAMLSVSFIYNSATSKWRCIGAV